MCVILQKIGDWRAVLRLWLWGGFFVSILRIFLTDAFIYV